MTFNKAKKIINSVSKDNWQSDNSPDGTFVTWFPIMKLLFDSAPQRIIGLSDTGFWTTQFHNGDIKCVDTRESCYHIMFCLEKERNEFENSLKTNLINHGLDEQLADTFPITELLKKTLPTESHWADKAALWLKESDMDKELGQILPMFIDNQRHSQKARHHAFKVLKQWQKSQ